MFYLQGYDITTRQEQLAKLIPSQLIELAYLSALLEQHPFSGSQPHSHKVKVVSKFLEEIVQVVPVESITHAIANGSYETAEVCLKVLLSSDLPLSNTQYNGLVECSVRVIHNIPIVGRQKFWNIERQNVGSTFGYRGMYDEKSNQTTFSAHPRIPGTMQLLPLTIGKFTVNALNEAKFSEELVVRFQKLHGAAVIEQDLHDMPLLSGVNVDFLYHFNIGAKDGHGALCSPINILKEGRNRLSHLFATSQSLKPLDSVVRSETKRSNLEMLETVNSIRNTDLATCASLLGGFMYQHEIDIPLVKTHRDSSELLSLVAAASVGVWALFSLKYSDIQPILAQCRGEQLLVKILEYVKTVSGVQSVNAPDEESGPYAAKVQFMVQGLQKAETVTCNRQYISYSLERQLVELCHERKINASISLVSLTKRWNTIFKDTTFSLVAPTHRSLIARWMKWALMIHNLREELAKYTSVGVVGLVNSGKSKLVNALFGFKVSTGAILLLGHTTATLIEYQAISLNKHCSQNEFEGIYGYYFY